MVAERPVDGIPAAPGLGGYVGGGIGDIGICLHKLVDGIARLDRVAASVEADSINVEKYVREIALTLRDVVAATGRMFEGVWAQKYGRAVRLRNICFDPDPRRF